MNTNKKYVYIAIVIILAVVATAAYYLPKNKKITEINSNNDYKNIAYEIDGQSILLKNGFAEIESASNSASKMKVQYFGNKLVSDINSDGREDVVFLLTTQTGGSGIFYYVVGALNTENGYIGTDGYFLGDRIAPQTIEKSQDTRHKDVIVVNYTERDKGEPMTAQPSISKSVYLKIDSKANRWAIVANNFGD